MEGRASLLFYSVIGSVFPGVLLERFNWDSVLLRFFRDLVMDFGRLLVNFVAVGR